MFYFGHLILWYFNLFFSENVSFASGPGKNQFDSCRIIATKLFEGAKHLLDNRSGREITGDVKYIHQFIDMSTSKAQFFNRTTNEIESVRSDS